MSTATGARASVVTQRPTSWWARETRIGRHLYPLRALAVTAAAGATAAVTAVVAAVSLLTE